MSDTTKRERKKRAQVEKNRRMPKQKTRRGEAYRPESNQRAPAGKSAPAGRGVPAGKDVPAGKTLLVETTEGLEGVCRAELYRTMGGQLRILDADPRRSWEIPVEVTGPLRPLLRLRSAQAVYLVQRYGTPRPRGLLGHEHLTRLLQQIRAVTQLHPKGEFRSFHISAAGENTTVMKRLREELAAATGLEFDAEEGDLLVRIRRSRGGEPSGIESRAAEWETLVRIAPRPLATRSWRVCNFEGALNAVVAHAMCQFTGPKAGDIFVNLACGSGSLLLERLGLGTGRLIGVDMEAEALTCARRNLEARNGLRAASLLQADARAAPLPTGCATALAADLPFGHLVGSHENNLVLYPAILEEAGRIAAPKARFALITHEVRLMEKLLANSRQWRTLSVTRVALGGLNPRIFLLERTYRP